MQLPSSHFTLVVKMAPDYNVNHTGPAHHNFDNLLLHTLSLQHFYYYLLYLFVYKWLPFVTDCIFIDVCALFKNFHHISQTVLGPYQLAQECRSLQELARRLQEPTLRTNQDFVQTSPLLDKLLFVLTTRSILVCQPEESLLTT